MDVVRGTVGWGRATGRRSPDASRDERIGPRSARAIALNEKNISKLLALGCKLFYTDFRTPRRPLGAAGRQRRERRRCRDSDGLCVTVAVAFDFDPTT